LTLNSEDYIELMPAVWRTINAYGITIDHRTYDNVDLDPYRRQPSGISTKGNRWEVHYDPYDLRHVWLRTPDGWVTVQWTHLPMVSAPFADFTWAHARQLAAERGRDSADQTAVAEALDDLLNRVGGDPAETKKTKRVRGRTRAAASAPLHPITTPEPTHGDEDEDADEAEIAHDHKVVPFGIFDAAEEAKRW
jgi:hypothetical protein